MTFFFKDKPISSDVMKLYDLKRVTFIILITFRITQQYVIF